MIALYLPPCIHMTFHLVPTTPGRKPGHAVRGFAKRIGEGARGPSSLFRCSSLGWSACMMILQVTTLWFKTIMTIRVKNYWKTWQQIWKIAKRSSLPPKIFWCGKPRNGSHFTQQNNDDLSATCGRHGVCRWWVMGPSHLPSLRTSFWNWQFFYRVWWFGSVRLFFSVKSACQCLPTIDPYLECMVVLLFMQT